MQRPALSSASALTGCALALLTLACGPDRPRETREAAGGTAALQKIPLTTSSDEARRLYVEGRDLTENLRTVEGARLLEQAVAQDPSFAMAHYTLAFTAPSTKEFLQHLKQAVALADQASEGERLAILGLEAGANADPARSIRYAEELVAKYPQDERARVNLAIGLTGEQKFDEAIEHLKHAVDVAPDYAPAYNILGYAYIPLGRYDDAEAAFKKYIELIPNDPNPYDSYAELLMKMGRFDESIAQYRKALSIDSTFAASRVGVTSNLMLQGRHREAIAEAQKLIDHARHEGDRRSGLLTQTIVYVDQGETDRALRLMDEQFTMGKAIGDTAAMAQDAASAGEILLDAGRTDQAAKRFAQSLELVRRSGLPKEVKDDAELGHHYHLGRVSLARKRRDEARQHAEAYLEGATERENHARIRQSHELLGAIALDEGKYDEALGHLEKADRQDPRVLYLTGLALQGKGDREQAAAVFGRAANMNGLPTLTYAFVRSDAKKPAPTS